MGGQGWSVAISVVHTWLRLLSTEPVPDWDTICSAHYFKLNGLSHTVLPGETGESGVEHDECLIFVQIILMVRKGISGSEAAFKRMNHLAPFF